MVPLVIGKKLEMKLTSGVLPWTSEATPGADIWTTTVAMYTGTPVLRLAVTPFVASGIDYLGEQMRAAGKGGLGGITPNGSFLVL